MTYTGTLLSCYCERGLRPLPPVFRFRQADPQLKLAAQDWAGTGCGRGAAAEQAAEIERRFNLGRHVHLGMQCQQRVLHAQLCVEPAEPVDRRELIVVGSLALGQRRAIGERRRNPSLLPTLVAELV